MTIRFQIIALVFIVSFQSCACGGELIDMRIVEEPSSLGFQQSYGNYYSQQEETLKLRVTPANFSGPLHFKRLIGRCFHSVIENYKYSFCPFANITQHEQNVHWNPYKGVLGVWQEWEVENNTFTAMMMKEGDACGDIFRSVKVILKCGNRSQIMNVTEPNRCNYELLFTTPLVCDPDSRLVYPTLTSDLQQEWNFLEGEMSAGELTEKGYKKRLRSIMEKAGIYLSRKDKEELVKKEAEKTAIHSGDFTDLMTCNMAYRTLNIQKEALSHQLSLRNISGPS